MKDYVDWVDDKNFFFDFDYIKTEQKEFENFVNSLPSFENPKNEQEKLFNLQKRYKSGEECLYEIYECVYVLTCKILKKTKNEQIRHMSVSQKESVAIQCADEITAWMKRKRYKCKAVKESFYSYIVFTLKSILFLRENREVFNYDIDFFLDDEKKKKD